MFDFLKSSIGRKYVMGLTGLVWLGFVLAHMAGNMLIFVSADLYNAYGHALISNKPLIYTAEGVLVVSIVIHIYTAITLTIQNRKSRQSRYALEPNGEKGPAKASQTMAIQGSMILAFIILHLITFKYGTVYTTVVGGTEMRDLHKLVIEVFNQPAYVAWYAVCLVLLMFHLSHGAHSIFQSFGILERKMQASLKKCAWIYAAVVAGGFLSQPLYVFLIHK